MADYKDIDANFEFGLEYRMDDYLLEVKDDYFGTLLFGTEKKEYQDQEEFRFEDEDHAKVDLDEYNDKDDFDETSLFFEDDKLVALEGSIFYESDDADDALDCFYELVDTVSDSTDTYPEIEVNTEDEEDEDADEEDYPEMLENDELSLTASWITPDLFLDISVFKDDGRIIVSMYMGVNPDHDSNFFAIDDGNFELLAKYVSPDLSYYDSKESMLEILDTKECPIAIDKAPFGFTDTLLDYDEAMRLFFVLPLETTDEDEARKLFAEKVKEIGEFYEDDGKLIEEDEFFNEYHYWEGFSTEAMLSLEDYKEGYALFLDISEMDDFIPCMMAEDDKPAFSDDTLEWAYNTLGIEVGSDMDAVSEAYASLMDDYSDEAENIDELPEDEQKKLQEKRYEIDEAFSILSEYYAQNDGVEFSEEEIVDALDTLGLKEGAGIQEVYDAYSSCMDEYVKLENPTDEEKERSEKVSDAFDLLIAYFDEEEGDLYDDDEDEEEDDDEEDPDLEDACDVLGVDPEDDDFDDESLMNAYLDALEEAEDDDEVEEIEECYDIIAGAYGFERCESPLTVVQNGLDYFGLDADSFTELELGDAYMAKLQELGSDEEKEYATAVFDLLKHYIALSEEADDDDEEWEDEDDDEEDWDEEESYFDFDDDSDEELEREVLAILGLPEDADEDEIEERVLSMGEYLAEDGKLDDDVRDELVDAINYLDTEYDIFTEEERRDDFEEDFKFFGLTKDATAEELNEAYNRMLTEESTAEDVLDISDIYFTLIAMIDGEPVMPDLITKALEVLGIEDEEPEEDDIVNEYYDRMSEADASEKAAINKAFDMVGAYYGFDTDTDELSTEALDALSELGLDQYSDDIDVADAIDDLYIESKQNDDIAGMKRAKDMIRILSEYFLLNEEAEEEDDADEEDEDEDEISDEEFMEALEAFGFEPEEEITFMDVYEVYIDRLESLLEKDKLDKKAIRTLVESFSLLMNTMN